MAGAAINNQNYHWRIALATLAALPRYGSNSQEENTFMTLPVSLYPADWSPSFGANSKTKGDTLLAF